VTTKKPLIAIVDDDESVCRAMERLVRSLCMAAETYASSEDFLNQIESLPALNRFLFLL
jgi:FixJ family two-component response regulator